MSSGIQLPTNAPVVGDRVFEVESGIIVSWLKNCGYEHALELFPYRWDLVGQPEPKVLIGKKSGLDTIRHYMEVIGRGDEADDDQLAAILAAVKERALRKRGLLEIGEFKAIVSRVIGRKPRR